MAWAKTDLAKLGRENWESDEDYPSCKGCVKPFHLFRRKHHCRACGHIFCKNCSSFYISMHREHYVRGEEKQKRVCQWCFEAITNERHATMNGASDILSESSAAKGTSAHNSFSDRADASRRTTLADEPEAEDQTLVPGGAGERACGDAASNEGSLRQGADRVAPAGGSLQRGADRVAPPVAPTKAEPAMPEVAATPGDASELRGPRWDAFRADQPALADAVRGCVEALGNNKVWENNAESVLASLRRAVAKAPRGEFRETPGKDQVILFCNRLQAKRPLYRRQTAEVRARFCVDQ